MLSKTIGGLIMQAIAVIFFLICCFTYQAQAIHPAAGVGAKLVGRGIQFFQQKSTLRNQREQISLQHTENALQIQQESFELYSKFLAEQASQNSALLLQACNPNRHLTELQQKEIERLKQEIERLKQDNAQLRELLDYYEKRLLK